MSQLRKRFTDEQIKVLFQSYCQGQISGADLQEMLGVGKSCFFVLLKVYRSNPDRFSIAQYRNLALLLSGHSKQSHAAALHQASIHQGYRKLPGDSRKFDKLSCPG